MLSGRGALAQVLLLPQDSPGLPTTLFQGPLTLPAPFSLYTHNYLSCLEETWALELLSHLTDLRAASYIGLGVTD